MGDEPIISIGGDGISARLYLAVDIETALLLSLAIFLALTGALVLYSKLK
jgi:hypothetical protein